ncbi:RHS repeat-associated core domain-containing protein [Alistipes sp. OttesenSCG-928-B03]|nr:RHS repeat-associated core domain-containing protein [Alistipes sp. OttesenSCG-928-B03]
MPYVKWFFDIQAFGCRWRDSLSLASDNRYLYNGKETQESFGVNYLDYGARMYDSRIGRWHSIDPLAERYLAYSPYAYCGNNPVILADSDGMQWDLKITAKGIVVSVNVNFKSNIPLSSETIRIYQTAIAKQFNETIRSASGGFVRGRMTFEGGSVAGRHVPLFEISGSDQPGNGLKVAGSHSLGDVNVSITGKDGKLLSPDAFAETAVHETFHTARLDHPFEKTQTRDTELRSTGRPNEYSSTPNTNQNIRSNIMNYDMIKIDGKSFKDANSGSGKNKLTFGQLLFLLREVQQQKQGRGAKPTYDPSASQQENDRRMKGWYDYWNNFPGRNVR